MALSLADELAGAFDSTEGAVGHSLADEFGLDEFAAEGHQDDHELEARANDEDNLPLPRSPFRVIDHNTSPQRRRPVKSSTESTNTFGHTSVSLVDEELDAALQLSEHYDNGHAQNADLEKVAEGPSSGFLGHKIEKDPIIILQSVLDSTSRFRSLMSGMDVPSGSRSTPVGALKSTAINVDDRLQTLLDRIHESDRIREDQYREMTVLLRDASGVNWTGIDIVDVLQPGHAGPSSDYRDMESVNQPQAPDEYLGWSGERSTHEQGTEDGSVELPSRHPPGSPEDSSHGIETLEHDQLLEDFYAHQALGSRERKPLLGSHASSSQAALPRQTNELVQTSTDLITSLSSLSDTAHSTSSLATATSRQLRGIKAGIDSWRDREAQEEEARIGVDAWERTRLKAGLGGTSTREALKKEVDEFQKVLDDAAVRAEALRQAYVNTTGRTMVLAR